MVRVNLEVPEKTKEEWEKAAESDPNSDGNLSGFVRSAVSEKMANQGERTDRSGVSDKVGEDVAELKDMIGQLANTVDSLSGRMKEIEHSLESDPDIENLASELLDILPDKGDIETWINSDEEVDYEPEERLVVVSGSLTEEGKVAIPVEDVPHAIESGRVEVFAHELGEKAYKIERAINYLKENTLLIGEETSDGETRIYREG